MLHKKGNNPQKYSISIIIPFHIKDEKFLDNVINLFNLANENINLKEFIIVFNAVDKNSEEKFEKLLNTKAKHNNKLKKIYFKEALIIGKARNVGADFASSDYLLFIDSDVDVPKESFQNLSTFLNDNPTQVNALMPHLKLHDTSTIWAMLDSYEDKISYESRICGKETISLIGPFLLVNKNIYYNCGKFEEKRICAEDRELAIRIIKQGYKIHFNKQVVVTHKNDPTLKRLIYRKKFHAEANAFIYTNHPDYYKKNLKNWAQYLVRSIIPSHPFHSLIYISIKVYYILWFTYFLKKHKKWRKEQ